MRSRSFAAFSFALSLLLLGCGQAGSQYSPLSSSQRTELREVVDGVTNIEAAVRLAKPTRETDAASSDVRHRMAARLAEGRCAISVLDPKHPIGFGGAGESKWDLALRASGQSCPIALDLGLSITAGPNQLRGQLDATYQVLADRDPEFARLSDITALTLKGTVEADYASGSASGRLDIRGGLTSVKYGAVTVSILGDLSGDSSQLRSTVTTLIVVPNRFTAELKQITTIESGGAPKEEYLLNGEKLTKQDFESEFQLAGFPKSGLRRP